MKLSVMFGTETGNAEVLCEDLRDALEADHTVTLANLEDVDPQALEVDRFHLFVSSTYGEGEPPASALPFVEALQANPPDLSGLRFAIFGLGDTTYEATYNNGSAVLMQALTAAGAQMVGVRGLHDASGFDEPLDLALPWAQARIAEAQALF